MSTTLAIAAFELKGRLKLISTWVYFLVFGAVALLWTLAAGGVFKNARVAFGSEKVWINAPYALMLSIGVLSVMALPVISAMMGRAVQQDFETNSHHAFFTSPITKFQYLSGRFLGALVTLLIVLSSIALGEAIGKYFPAVDADRVGVVSSLAYVWPYVIVVLPNLVMMGAIFFSLGALTRRMLPVYVVSALLLIGYLIAVDLTANVENRWLASLLDPFGVTAVANLTEYWPVAERNVRFVPLEGYVLANRALWLGLALVALAFAFRRFKFTYAESSLSRKQKAEQEVEVAAAPSTDDRWKRAQPSQPQWMPVLGALTWLNFKETAKNVYFGVIVLTGLLFVFAMSSNLDSTYGTNTYPVTYKMLDMVGGQFGIFMLILITFYSGELVWRERDARVDQIHDALPVPTWVPMLSKLFALMLIPFMLQFVVMLAAMGLQLTSGYTKLEPGLYFQHLFGMQLINYWGLCALAFTVQVLVNQKYLGHFVMVVYFIAVTFSGPLGFEHRLYRLFQIGVPAYSDMNAYGHYLARIRWLELYWGLFAVMLLLLARLFWQRGTVVGFRSRLMVARSRLSKPVAIGGVAALVAFAATGGYIYYNTNVVNRYRPSYAINDLQARYEKEYRDLLITKPQAKITAVNVNVDMYPHEQRVRGAGTFTLTNKEAVPIAEVWVNVPEFANAKVDKLEFDRPAKLLKADDDFGIRGYRFDTPLKPGEKVTLSFDVTQAAQGFRNDSPYTQIVHNGSFINNWQFLPSFGYREEAELTTDNDRKKYGLKPKDRARDRADPEGLKRSYISGEADWIDFETVVSTVPNQIAIAPGYLQKEWEKGDRRYFHYKMDSPILNFYAFLSADYQVKRDRWNDVAIEVYHHKGHEYNLDRMIASTKDSLDYFTKAFGPYQHKQFRIIEFPRYARFAQAFPNTIPYSEALGFIAKVRDKDENDLDYPYYITSHEMAHQWWAHQVIGANVQGATVLSESLAQYSSLMVMKKKYGDAKMKRFLRYELDRYLRGRATENKREVPLARVENQPYIHYAKGSLVMYALQDYFGEDRVNQAIRAYRDATAYQGPPYTTTHDFIGYLRKAAPPGMEYLVDDLFERIVVFENRAVKTEAKPLDGDRHQVTIKVLAKKMLADERGAEKETALNDLIEIGVLDKDAKPLYLKKERLKAGENEFVVVVDGIPARAGIDPLNKLIDRTPNDNVMDVKIESK